MENKDEKKKSNIWAWLGVFFGGVVATLTTLFMGKRNNTDIRKGFDDTREQLSNAREQLGQAKDNINELEDTINSSERAIRESREILERVRKERK